MLISHAINFNLKQFISGSAISLLIWSGTTWCTESTLSSLTPNQLKILHRLIITEKEFGPVEIGMHLDEASEVLGIDIKMTKFQYGDVQCHSYALGTSEYDWVVRFTTRDGMVGRIDVYDPAIFISNGLTVGKPMKDVQSMYVNQYKIYPGHEWPDKSIVITGINGMSLKFKGPLLSQQDIQSAKYPIDKVNEVIGSISIGLQGVGTIEGCL